jgi:hypothetical protein
MTNTATNIETTGYYADDGNAEVHYPDADSAGEAAQRYVDEGDWGESDTTRWVRVHVYRAHEQWDDGWWITVPLDPEEPPCRSEEGEHDWQNPIELVGGIRENPGVFGHGGGVKIHEVCVRCGARRVTDTWAQDPCTGEQGLESVTYEPAGTIDLSDYTPTIAAQISKGLADIGQVTVDGDEIRCVVAVPTSTRDGDDAYEAACDEIWETVRTLLPEGWQCRWLGSGNTDADGDSSEDMLIKRT